MEHIQITKQGRLYRLKPDNGYLLQKGQSPALHSVAYDYSTIGWRAVEV